MADHLSDLVLDELAAGDVVGEDARAHLSQCSECTARVASLTSARAAFNSSLDAQRVKQRVLAKADAAAPRWQRWAPVVGLGLAASLALVVWAGGGASQGGNQVKGTAVFELAGANGAPVKEAMAGEQLQLRVGGAGFKHGVVLAVDAQRHAECLWSGEVPAGITVVQQLTVTPGDVRAHLLLGPEPLPCEPAAAAYQQALQQPDVTAPAAPNGGTVLSLSLHVRP